MATSMNLADIYVFKKVAATLSFSQAARLLGISRSAVSKQISRLEHDLGVVLINRTTRNVNLTEAGRTFDTQTAKVESTIQRAAELVRGADKSPLGTVSFSMPSGLGAVLMPALTQQFKQQWPELHLNIHFDDYEQDLIASDLDLAIRISKKLSDSNMVARRLASTKKVLAASPQYWRRNGIPKNPQELADHCCLGLTNATDRSAQWTIYDGQKPVDVAFKCALSANNHLALILAACLDGGVIYVPEICIENDLKRGLLETLPEWVEPEPYGIYALYPHRKAAAKVKVLVEFIEQLLRHSNSLDRWAPVAEPGNDLSETDSPTKSQVA